MLLSVGVTLICVVIGYPAAFFLVRHSGKWSGFIIFLLLSPLSMRLIVVGFALLFYLSALGLGVSFTSLLIAHTVIGLFIVERIYGLDAMAPAT